MTNSRQGFLVGALGRQQQVVQFGVLGLGALIAFAETRGDFYVGALMYALVPFASTALLALWYVDARRVMDLVRRVGEDGTEDSSEVDALSEREPRRMQVFAALVGTTFLVTSVAGVTLGFHELDVVYPIPPPNDLLWTAWIASVVTMIANVALLIFAVLRIRR